MDQNSNAVLVDKMLATLRNDLRVENNPRSLTRIDNYLHGKHDPPYIPDEADQEYMQLTERCITNWMPLLVSTPAQAMYIDGFRPGGDGRADDVGAESPQWDAWQRSMMDSRQASVHRAAIAYGHSFVAVEKQKDGKSRLRPLSPLRTVAYYDDPAVDVEPVAVLYVKRWAFGKPGDEDFTDGEAILWDKSRIYDVTFGSGNPTVSSGTKHGASECPVTRFASYVDLDGRTKGVIEPMIPTQDRMNQSVFDLLVAQTYNSFEVRYATGMAVPVRRDPTTREPILDQDGNEIPLPIRANAKRFMVAEDHETKFGSLAGTSLDGFVTSIDMTVRHFAAMSQLPPHYLLGQVANLSAEALSAAEQNLMRMCAELQKQFGEAWERVFRIVAQIEAIDGSDDYHAEVQWRDMGSQSLSMIADALGKLKENLEVPARGLWKHIPGITPQELGEWAQLREEDDVIGTLASRLENTSVSGDAYFSDSSSSTPQVEQTFDLAEAA